MVVHRVFLTLIDNQFTEIYTLQIWDFLIKVVEISNFFGNVEISNLDAHLKTILNNNGGGVQFRCELRGLLKIIFIVIDGL